MSKDRTELDASDHRRDRVGLKYVYPVLSRRAGGVSVGINLNTNNACNWACRYCQVPGLVRGVPEPVDLALLASELDAFLQRVLRGDFMLKHVPQAARRLADIAFSGNGEPTAAPEFGAAVEVVISLLNARSLSSTVPLRLITNGSLVSRPSVLAAIARIGSTGGEVWFKVDRGTRAGIAAVNGVWLDPETVLERLRRCCGVAPTWIQTCWFGIDGTEPSQADVDAYLDFASRARRFIRGVLLYGIAREPMQPGSEHLQRLSPEALARFGRQIEAQGIAVTLAA